MGTFLRTMLTAIATLALGGCSVLPQSHLVGIFLTESSLTRTIEGKDFNAHLAREYQALANDKSWFDSAAYARKSAAAFRGKTVPPWDPSLVGVGGEAFGLYARLVDTIRENRDLRPYECAHAQVRYDHWLGKMSEGNRKEGDTDVLRDALEQAIVACREAVPSDGVIFADAATPSSPGRLRDGANAASLEEPEGARPEVRQFVSAPGAGRLNADAGSLAVPEPNRAAALQSGSGSKLDEAEPKRSALTPARHYQAALRRSNRDKLDEAEPERSALTPARHFTIHFGFDSHDLTGEADGVIGQLLSALDDYFSPRLRIVGHTDRAGPAIYNQRLSERRAQSVVRRLVREGVPRHAMESRGSGERENILPTADNVREARNRRVEVTIFD